MTPTETIILALVLLCSRLLSSLFSLFFSSLHFFSLHLDMRCDMLVPSARHHVCRIHARVPRPAEQHLPAALGDVFAFAVVASVDAAGVDVFVGPTLQPTWWW